MFSTTQMIMSLTRSTSVRWAVGVEAADVTAVQLIDPEAYRPVLTVASHDEWPVAVRTDAAGARPHGLVPGIAPGSARPDRPSTAVARASWKGRTSGTVPIHPRG